MSNEGFPRLSDDCKILINFVEIQPKYIRLNGLVVELFGNIFRGAYRQYHSYGLYSESELIYFL